MDLEYSGRNKIAIIAAGVVLSWVGTAALGSVLVNVARHLAY